MLVCSMGPALERAEGESATNLSNLQQLLGTVDAKNEALEIQLYAGVTPFHCIRLLFLM
jgi:hypothetical protein